MARRRVRPGRSRTAMGGLVATHKVNPRQGFLAFEAQIRAQTGLGDRRGPSAQRGGWGSSPLSSTGITAGQRPSPVRSQLPKLAALLEPAGR
jgi:hypothetical protein